MAYNLGGGASGLVPYTGSGDAAGTPRVFCADGSTGQVYVVNMGALASFQSGTLIAPAPVAPTIALSGVAYSSANYTLGAGTGGAPSGYQVQFRVTGSGSAFTNFGSVVTGLTGTITGLSASTGYDVQVVASNAAGSATSAVQTITTPAQPAQSAAFSSGPASSYTQGATIAVNGTATSIAQVYVSQTIGGAEQTPRTAATMSGTGPYTWSASFTAAVGTGETIGVYAAATGGTALQVSSAYNVTPVTGSVATPSTVQSGNPEAVSGTCSGASTVYVSLSSGGTEQLPRTSAAVTGGNWTATLTPSGAGTYTASFWTAATGGSPVATSSAFTVTPSPYPLIFSGTAGSAPTGAQAYTPIVGSGDVIHSTGTGLDLTSGSGSYGVFAAAGMTAASQTITATIASGSASENVTVGRFTGASISAPWVVAVYTASSGLVQVYQQTSSGSGGTLVGQATGATNASTVALDVASGGCYVYVNGTSVNGGFGLSAAASAAGYVGIGPNYDGSNTTTISRIDLS